MTHIEVSDVELAKEALPTLDREKALHSLLHAPVEQLSPGSDLVLCTTLHPLAAAAECAFYEHRPLVLSPDAVWFCLAQGLAQHVSLNAEALRERFVRHQGQATLLVNRPDFLLGQQNPWPEVFAAFSEQIAAHVGKLRELVVPDFSTTGPTERAAFEVALMETFEPYFQYSFRVGCGIPSVMLTGTSADWRLLRQRAAMLSELGLEWWTRPLMPVLDELVLSSEGKADRAFWQSFFRHESESGRNELTGWIQLLFPYLTEVDFDELEDPFTPQVDFEEKEPSSKTVRNRFLSDWHAHFRAAERRRPEEWVKNQGPSLGQLPGGLASAPVVVSDVRDGSQRALRFVAGLFGVSQDASGALAPEFGWAVVHDPQIQT